MTVHFSLPIDRTVRDDATNSIAVTALPSIDYANSLHPPYQPERVRRTAGMFKIGIDYITPARTPYLDCNRYRGCGLLAIPGFFAAWLSGSAGACTSLLSQTIASHERGSG